MNHTPSLATRTLFRSLPMTLRRISPTESLLSTIDGEKRMVVPTRIGRMAMATRDFRTLEDHARGYWSGIGLKAKLLLVRDAMEWLESSGRVVPFGLAAPVRVLSQVYEVFAREEFLLPAEGFFASVNVNGTNGAKSPDKISTVGIVTCNRIQNLTRCVSSFVESGRRHGRDADFAVFDDSPTRDAVEPLKEIKKKTGARILYAGHQQKHDFVSTLVAKGFPKDVLDFCLFGWADQKPSTGANRNSFLLHTVGELAFSTDDDTVCTVYKSPSYEEGIRVGGKGNDRGFWNDARVREFLSKPPEDVDLVDLHERVLAAPPANLLNDLVRTHPDGPRGILNLDDDLLTAIARKKSKIIISLNGSAGNGGTVDPSSLIFLKGKAREEFLRSEESFMSSLKDRKLIRAFDRLTIFNAVPMVSSMFFGLDHREIVPPFFPLYRSQDTLFGAMVNDCIPGGSFAYLPWVVLHAHDEERTYTEGAETIGQIRPVDFIVTAMSEIDIQDTSVGTAQRLQVVGARLKELGSMPPEAFSKRLQWLQKLLVSQNMASLELMLAKYPGSPRYWKDFVTARLEKFRHVIDNPTDGIPTYMKPLGTAGALEVYQRILVLYGQLLTLWPSITEATLEQKRQGVRLAREV
jgi:hypothetical protein